MEGFILSFVGCLLCFVEAIVIIWILYEILDIEEYPLWIGYSALILALNLIPAFLIARGEPLFWADHTKTIFSISSICAIFSVIVFLIAMFIMDGDGDDSLFITLIAYLLMAIILIIIFTAIASSSTKVVNQKSYIGYYEISEDNGKPSVLYMSDKDENNSYYVVEYKTPNDDGSISLNILQLSPSDVDITIAIEEEDKNYLIVTTTEVIKEDTKLKSGEPIVEKSYSYKILLMNELPTANIIPIVK